MKFKNPELAEKKINIIKEILKDMELYQQDIIGRIEHIKYSLDLYDELKDQDIEEGTPIFREADLFDFLGPIKRERYDKWLREEIDKRLKG